LWDRIDPISNLAAAAETTEAVLGTFDQSKENSDAESHDLGGLC